MYVGKYVRMLCTHECLCVQPTQYTMPLLPWRDVSDIWLIETAYSYILILWSSPFALTEQVVLSGRGLPGLPEVTAPFSSRGLRQNLGIGILALAL